MVKVETDKVADDSIAKIEVVLVVDEDDSSPKRMLGLKRKNKLFEQTQNQNKAKLS